MVKWWQSIKAVCDGEQRRQNAIIELFLQSRGRETRQRERLQFALQYRPHQKQSPAYGENYGNAICFLFMP